MAIERTTADATSAATTSAANTGRKALTKLNAAAGRAPNPIARNRGGGNFNRYEGGLQSAVAKRDGLDLNRAGRYVELQRVVVNAAGLRYQRASANAVQQRMHLADTFQSLVKDTRSLAQLEQRASAWSAVPGSGDNQALTEVRRKLEDGSTELRTTAAGIDTFVASRAGARYLSPIDPKKTDYGGLENWQPTLTEFPLHREQGAMRSWRTAFFIVHHQELTP